MFYDPKWDKKINEVEKKDEWREILLKAAQLIEEKGWIREEFSKNGYCMIGAINKVLGRRPSNENFKTGKNASLGEEVVEHLSKAMKLRGTGLFGADFPENRIMSWNDNKAKNKETVIKVLRDCANKGK